METKLPDILGIDNPWPLVDVLRKLVEATEILLKEHDYDGLGWEQISHCVDRGREIIKMIENGN